MKKLVTLVGALLGAACLVLFLRSAAKHWDAFQGLSLDVASVGCLLAALACYLCTHCASAAGWRLSLSVFNETVRYVNALRIVTLSQIGKYIPGNVGQHVGRVVLAQRAGIATSRAVMSLALESVLLLVVAALCCLSAFDVLIQAAGQHAAAIQRNLLVVFGAGVMVPLLLLLVPWSRGKFMHFLHRWLELFSWRNAGVYFRLAVVQAASFVIGAMALWFALQAVSPVALAAPWSVLGIYSIAWLLGFLIPGAPAGLGIREALLVMGLSSLYSYDTVVLGTALFRLVTLLGDGLAFLLGFALRHVRA